MIDLDSKEWRNKGVYRLTADLPIDLWKALQARAKRDGVKPIHLIRKWLVERLEQEKVR